MVLLAAVNVLLARASGRPDVAVCTPLSSRYDEASEDPMGYYLATLVLRTDLSDDPAFVEVLRRVRGTLLDAYEYEDTPFDLLLGELEQAEVPGAPPLFPVNFLVNNVAPVEWDLPGVDVEEHRLAEGPARFDLTVAMDTGSGLSGYIRYRAELFDRGRIERMRADLLRLLAMAANTPRLRLSDVDNSGVRV
jgi:non-ribosomal peptide synthetase component F